MALVQSRPDCLHIDTQLFILHAGLADQLVVMEDRWKITCHNPPVSHTHTGPTTGQVAGRQRTATQHADELIPNISFILMLLACHTQHPTASCSCHTYRSCLVRGLRFVLPYQFLTPSIQCTGFSHPVTSQPFFSAAIQFPLPSPGGAQQCQESAGRRRLEEGAAGDGAAAAARGGGGGESHGGGPEAHLPAPPGGQEGAEGEPVRGTEEAPGSQRETAGEGAVHQRGPGAAEQEGTQGTHPTVELGTTRIMYTPLHPCLSLCLSVC